jgi:diguanylate cyclase (GGDEF)-like protein/PAS domain S-box-containing protein
MGQADATTTESMLEREVRLIRRLPVFGRLFVGGMVAAGALLLIFAAEGPRVEQIPEFIGLLLASALTSAFKLTLPVSKSRATMSVSFVVDFTALLIFGTPATMVIAALGALTQSTVEEKKAHPIHQTLFNIACLVVTIQAAGIVHGALGGTIGSFMWPWEATPLAAAVIVYFLVNSGSIALAVAMSTGQPPLRVWQKNFLWGGPNYFIGATVAALMAEIIAHRAWGFLPLAAIPIYMTYRAYGVYLERLEEERRHREIIESLNEGMAVIDGRGRVTLWNDALERIMLCSREHVLGRPLTQAIPVLRETELSATIDTVFATGEPKTIEHFTLHHDVRRRILQVRVFPFVGGVTVFWNDVTDRAEAEDRLKLSEERYALAAAGANDGLWDWDLRSGAIYFSPRWKAMIGLNADTPCDRPEAWFERVHAQDLQPLKAALDDHVSGKIEHFQHEHRIRHENGRYRWMLCRGVAVRGADTVATRIAGSLTDITERAATQEYLRRAALHDALTGLPNRTLFLELLSQALDQSKRRPERRFAVLFLDVDRFKIINDSLGHLAGDELLISVSRRLESCLREGDALARLGGDEFTILLSDLEHVSQATVIAERIQTSLQTPLLVGGREVFTSASIGIAFSGADYSNPEDIMRDADTAMYRAKTLGKARHEVFDADMHAEAVDRLGLENDLRHAIERGEFSLYYQPIVSMSSGWWTGVEALLRWKRGDKWVSPQTFLPVAEETGLIEQLGSWVIREACRQVADWRKMFPQAPALSVLVNVSSRQLIQPQFVEVVRTAVREASLKPDDLRLEITETTLKAGAEAAESVLRQLRQLGVKIYLDDFGTGFTSLSSLHRLQVDSLKIDRSFVATVTDTGRPAVVESIIALAKTLGTDVIAEGVENERQARELARLGCGEAQGFFFAGPLPTSAAKELLATGHLNPLGSIESAIVSTQKTRVAWLSAETVGTKTTVN